MEQVKRIMKVYQRHTQHRLSEVVDGDHKLMDNMDNLLWLINAGKEMEKLGEVNTSRILFKRGPSTSWTERKIRRDEQ